MTKRCSRKEWLKKRDAMNAQLRHEIKAERRGPEENLEPLAPGLDQLPQHKWPVRDDADDERPYYLRND